MPKGRMTRRDRSISLNVTVSCEARRSAPPQRDAMRIPAGHTGPAEPARRCRQAIANRSTFHRVAVMPDWRSAMKRRVASMPPERGQGRPVKCRPIDIEQGIALNGFPGPIGRGLGIMRVRNAHQLKVFLDDNPQGEVRGRDHPPPFQLPSAAAPTVQAAEWPQFSPEPGSSGPARGRYIGWLMLPFQTESAAPRPRIFAASRCRRRSTPSPLRRFRRAASDGDRPRGGRGCDRWADDAPYEAVTSASGSAPFPPARARLGPMARPAPCRATGRPCTGIAPR